jgi:glycerophosphoryl diester phosphodiesterase
LGAHRGGAALAPENTLEAFRQAVDAWGADLLEMDVRVTADGELVVIHDATVERTTEGAGPVAELTWAELRRLDAGFRFRDATGEASFAGRGVRVPRFEDVLTALPRARLNVEAKCREAAGPLVDIVLAHHAAHRVLVAAEHEPNRRAARRYPGPWGASRAQLRPFWMLHRVPWLGALYTPRVDVLQVPVSWKGRVIVTRRFVEEAHRRNLPVHVWVVDEPAEMRRLLALGVDSIQSDRPDLLARVLHEDTGRPLPPALARAAGRVAAAGGGS